MIGEGRTVPDDINQECIVGVDFLDGFLVDDFACRENGDVGPVPDYAFVVEGGGARHSFGSREEVRVNNICLEYD